jgi:hypothetical protein
MAANTLTTLPMDDSELASLRDRLATLEKEVKSLRQELAWLRKQPLADLDPTPGLVTGEQAPYGLSVPAAQPDLPVAGQPPKSAPKGRKSAPKTEAPEITLAEAKLIILNGYVLDHPGNADRLLKTLVFRLLDGSVKGFKSVDLNAARIVARSMLEHSGIRSTGPGFNDMRLRSLMRKYVPFEPITSIRRLPR